MSQNVFKFIAQEMCTVEGILHLEYILSHYNGLFKHKNLNASGVRQNTFIFKNTLYENNS